MRLLLIGNHGQLGTALQMRLQLIGEVHAFDRDTLDITDRHQVLECVGSIRPDVIVNAAAYTNVDRAEIDLSEAERINADGPKHLARISADHDAALIHFSTDYVFDGTKGTPYEPHDQPNPINAYGRSKLAGERAVCESDARGWIVRTSWLYGPESHNFLRTMLRMIDSCETARVVNDQRGCPTSTLVLSDWIASICAQIKSDDCQAPDRIEVLHLACNGDATWYALGKAIFDAFDCGDRITPINSAEYPTVAKRPLDTRLDSSTSLQSLNLQPVHWSDALDATLHHIRCPQRDDQPH